MKHLNLQMPAEPEPEENILPPENEPLMGMNFIFLVTGKKSINANQLTFQNQVKLL
jgi:hypothetical protein